MGIISVLGEPYLCVVSSCKPVGTFMGDRVYRIMEIEFEPFKYRFLYESVDQSDCKKVLEGIRSSVVN
jgi:hypothetical protein